MCMIPPWDAHFAAIPITREYTLPAEEKACGYHPLWQRPEKHYWEFALSKAVSDKLNQVKVRLDEQAERRRLTRPEQNLSAAEGSRMWDEVYAGRKKLDEPLREAVADGRGDDFVMLTSGSIGDYLQHHSAHHLKVDWERLALQIGLLIALSGCGFLLLGGNRARRYSVGDSQG